MMIKLSTGVITLVTLTRETTLPEPLARSSVQAVVSLVTPDHGCGQLPSVIPSGTYNGCAGASGGGATRKENTTADHWDTRLSFVHFENRKEVDDRRLVSQGLKAVDLFSFLC